MWQQKNGIASHNGTYIRTYAHAHIMSYVHTYIRNIRRNVHTYILTYVHTYIRRNVLHCIVHSVHTHIRTYVHTYIRTYIRTYVHRYVHEYLCTTMALFFEAGHADYHRIGQYCFSRRRQYTDLIIFSQIGMQPNGRLLELGVKTWTDYFELLSRL